MATDPSFSQEISNLLYTLEKNPVDVCIQCGMCTSGCPAAGFMDRTPRELIAMIRADLKEDVLAANTYWTCASCYNCTVRCSRGLDIAAMMYALKRYSLWRNAFRKKLIGPSFAKSFVKMILKRGRSFEPGLAPVFLFENGLRGFWDDVMLAMALFFKGRIPLFPGRIRRIKAFRRMVNRILPVGN